MVICRLGTQCGVITPPTVKSCVFSGVRLGFPPETPAICCEPPTEGAKVAGLTPTAPRAATQFARTVLCFAPVVEFSSEPAAAVSQGAVTPLKMVVFDRYSSWIVGARNEVDNVERMRRSSVGAQLRVPFQVKAVPKLL